MPATYAPVQREHTAQGRLGDGGIVATLGAVAGHLPEAIWNAMAKTGEEGKYLIRLHEAVPVKPGRLVARTTGDTITYRVSDEIPVTLDDPRRPPLGVQANRFGWPSLMEKVVATQDQTWDTEQRNDWEEYWLVNLKPLVDADRRSHGLGPSPDEPPTGYSRLDMGSDPYQRADLLAQITAKTPKSAPSPTSSTANRPS